MDKLIDLLIKAEKATRIKKPMGTPFCVKYRLKNSSCKGCKYDDLCRKRALEAIKTTIACFKELKRLETRGG